MLDGGKFLCKLSRRFGHRFSSIRLLYCYQLLGLRRTQLTFRSARLRLGVDSGCDFTNASAKQSADRYLPFSWRSKSNFTVGAGSIVGGKNGGELYPQPTLLRGCVSTFNRRCCADSCPLLPETADNLLQTPAARPQSDTSLALHALRIATNHCHAYSAISKLSKPLLSKGKNK